MVVLIKQKFYFTMVKNSITDKKLILCIMYLTPFISYSMNYMYTCVIESIKLGTKSHPVRWIFRKK